jgi:hypothetical protein
VSGDRATSGPASASDASPAADARSGSGPDATPDGGNGSSKAGRLARYLRAEARAAGGELYFKGKFIADDVGLSPKEIGALMPRLQESASELSIEPWSYTGATTWRVETRREPATARG